jgi:3-methyladenine DNA glycosylase AlkD
MAKPLSSRAQEVLVKLRAEADPANVAGMARYGFVAPAALGVRTPAIRRIARECGKSHELAAELWDSGIHEARAVAALVDEVDRVTPRQMDRWARSFYSWDDCDGACANLFRYTPFAFEKAREWARAEPEFVRRAAFALMAGLAVKAKQATDEDFEPFFAFIVEAAGDERNMVKKAVNWALRQIGKRNQRLRRRAIAVAEEIRRIDSAAARWIAADALRELRARGG